MSSLPTLVILDEKGATVTTDGRAAVAKPELFPWVPLTLAEALGDTFVGKGGEVRRCRLTLSNPR